MIKRFVLTLLAVSVFFSSSLSATPAASGLESNNPEFVYLVYMIETDDVDRCEIKALVNSKFGDANIQQVKRDDAQLFLRVEKHADEYLLYLDFSRKVQYSANGQLYEKDGFVWGRYIKDIADTETLLEDVEFLLDDFIKAYNTINNR